MMPDQSQNRFQLCLSFVAITTLNEFLLLCTESLHDYAAAHNSIAGIENCRLSRCDGKLWCFKFYVHDPVRVPIKITRYSVVIVSNENMERRNLRFVMPV